MVARMSCLKNGRLLLFTLIYPNLRAGLRLQTSCHAAEAAYPRGMAFKGYSGGLAFDYN